MFVADTYLGHRDDPAVADALEEATSLDIEITDTERRRSRFRTTTEDGRAVGVVIGRDLRDGDVLDADGTLLVVRLEPIEAMVLDFTGADVAPTTALSVGHAVGNRHWKLAVLDEEVLLPVTDDRERMEETVRPLERAGVERRYADVSPTTFDEAPGSLHGGHRNSLAAHHHGPDGGVGHIHDHGQDDHHERGDVRQLEPDRRDSAASSRVDPDE